MIEKSEFQSRLNNLKKNLGNTQLVAVTKYSQFEDIKIAYECGVRDFGENRVNDLNEKSKLSKKEGMNIKWHFIGGLQSNKIKSLFEIENLNFIHSIDSLKLVKEMVKRKSHFKGSELNLFFQMNTSFEEEKGGFKDYPALKEAIEIGQRELFDSRIRFHGLMTMGKIRTEDFQKDARASFSALEETRRLVEEDFGLSNLKLSMGMSKDYKIALEIGTDYIRVGSVLFKE